MVYSTSVLRVVHRPKQLLSMEIFSVRRREPERDLGVAELPTVAQQLGVSQVGPFHRVQAQKMSRLSQERLLLFLCARGVPAWLLLAVLHTMLSFIRLRLLL